MTLNFCFFSYWVASLPLGNDPHMLCGLPSTEEAVSHLSFLCSLACLGLGTQSTSGKSPILVDGLMEEV
jgi:hypothetical protein